MTPDKNETSHSGTYNTVNGEVLISWLTPDDLVATKQGMTHVPTEGWYWQNLGAKNEPRGPFETSTLAFVNAKRTSGWAQ